MNSITIAIIAYNMIVAYSKAIGEPEPPLFEDLSEERRQSYVDGVEYVLNNPDAGPSAQHDMWLMAKQADGWVYGEEKDEEKKTHPCILPFDDLPEPQRVKDTIFRASVLMAKLWEAALPTPEEKPAEAAAAAPAPAPAQVYTGEVPPGFTPVKYIGKRLTYVENNYGTGITFTQGKTELVESGKAALLFKHPDQYVPGVASEAPKDVPVKKVEKTQEKKSSEDTDEDLQQARDLVANMDVEGLRTYAQTNYQQKLHHNIGVEKARAAVTQLIDQYGLK